MRKRPRGWRTLQLGEVEVWWTVGRPRVTEPSGEARVQSIAITITARRADATGAKLVATVRGRRAIAVPAASFDDVQTVAVTPEVVRTLVETAASRGVWPQAGTWRTEMELPQLPLPDLTFRTEHLAQLHIVWTAE